MNFTAPKNFKRGRLIANKYTVTDLLIAGAGIGTTLFLEILFLTTAVSKRVAANLIKAVIFMRSNFSVKRRPKTEGTISVYRSAK